MAVGEHEDVLLLLGEPQLLARQPRLLQLALRQVQLPGDDARDLLLPGDPVQGHLRAHVVVQGALGVVLDDLLPGALSLAHGLEAAVPVEELEDGHELLELEHRLAEVGLEHEAKGAHAGAGPAAVATAAKGLCGRREENNVMIVRLRLLDDREIVWIKNLCNGVYSV